MSAKKQAKLPPSASFQSDARRPISSPYASLPSGEDDSAKRESCRRGKSNAASDGDAASASSFSFSSASVSGSTMPTVENSASALVIAASDKAGMDGIDRAKIDAIILRESGNSAFMQQQRKRDASVDVRIGSMKRRLASIVSSRPGWKQELESDLETEVNRLLRARSVRSTCVVVDMDGFYISCEMLSRPELGDVPACVGGGMICTSNYRARRYGVRAAMAGFIGDRLVLELSGGTERLVHVPLNFDLYKAKAEQVRVALAEFDPNLRSYSLDEAYLDLGPYLELRLGKGWAHERVAAALECRAKSKLKKQDGSCDGSEVDAEDMDGDSSENLLSSFSSSNFIKAASDVVKEMRGKVHEATGGLTCSAGLAPNFMLAKIASDRNKPDGQLVVGPSNEEILAFVRDMPVRKVPGIGRVMEKILAAFEIRTVRNLFDERALVRLLFKPASAAFLLQASLGWSDTERFKEDEEDPSSGRKGISHERTFQPGKSWDEINSKLEDIAHLLCEDMQKKNIWARTITLKVKLHTFDVLSKSKSMPRGVHVQSAKDIVPAVALMLVDLKRQHRGAFSVRLLGIRCSNFRGEEDKAENVSRKRMQQFLSHKASLRDNSRSVSKAATASSTSSPSSPPSRARCWYRGGGTKRVPGGCKRLTLDGDDHDHDHDDGDDHDDETGSTKKRRAVAEGSTAVEAKRRGTVRTATMTMTTTTLSSFRNDADAPPCLDDDRSVSFSCPICGRGTFASESDVDRHLDSCAGTPLAMPPPTTSTPTPTQSNDVRCPICNVCMCGDNRAWNGHIDTCLSGKKVRQLVREESAAAGGYGTKKRSLADFFK